MFFPKRLYILFLTLCTTLLTAQESADLPADYSELYHVMDIWLEAQKDYDDLPGISVAIVRDQEIVYARGFGQVNRESQANSETSTIYSICSISKLFTATAIMKLYDEGKLRLDDRVEDLLPFYDLSQQYAESGPITVRSLLTHSSGLPREAANPYWTGPDFPFPTQEEVRAGLKDQETLYPAATYFQYSNLGLTLLGEIVEEVSGQKYSAYIHEHILAPLQMNTTQTSLPEDLYGSKLAVGYSARKRNAEREKVKLFQAEGVAPAAGFSSNVTDLAEFAKWQFRLLEDGGQEILKASTLRNMHRVHWVNPDWNTTWGLGFSVYESDGGTRLGHGGSCPGYRSNITMSPKDKVAIVVMINAGGTNPSKYVNGLAKLMDKYGEPENLDSVNLEDYQGFYSAQPWWSEQYIFPWKGKLGGLGLPSSGPADFSLFKKMGTDLFKRIRDNDELGEEVRFERDASGKVLRYWQHGNERRKLRMDN